MLLCKRLPSDRRRLQALRQRSLGLCRAISPNQLELRAVDSESEDHLLAVMLLNVETEVHDELSEQLARLLGMQRINPTWRRHSA